MSPTYTATPVSTTGKNSPCHCHEPAPAPCTCCGLTCFDRPNYFCGHLLTDADLSLEQKYVIEKNKMYHRAIDGYGIACGLKLTCDCQCKGNIWIHKGFAIDDCGNDLVVCEDTRFDVIGALKRKGLLLSNLDPDDPRCEQKPPRNKCSIKQCFYVAICYDEQQSDFETPYQSGCTAGPKPCLPTRTKERVRFDVTDKPPAETSYLDDLEERFKECFKIYCEGPVGQIMKKHLRQLQIMVAGKASLQNREENQPLATETEVREPWRDPCELFCTLRAYFLNQLKNSPDEFNCNLYEEVACLRCPERDQDDDVNATEIERKRYATEVQDAYVQLLTYMQRYQFDCALGELVFSCEQPCESHCLVLGTVEIVDGKLTRVCNTPRKYLWAPANFVQVAIYTLLSGSLTSKKAEGEEDCATCCPDYPNFSAEQLLEEFALSQCGRYHAVTAGLRTAESLRSTLFQRFDFSDTRNIARQTLENVTKSGTYAGIHVKVSNERASTLESPNLMQSIVTGGLFLPEEQVSLYHAVHAGDPPTVLPDFVANISPDRTVGKSIEEKLGAIKKKAVTDDVIEALLNRVKALEDQLKLTQDQPKVDSAEHTSKKTPKKAKE